MRALHPLGRGGRPGEVAAAVSYLLLEDARFIFEFRTSSGAARETAAASR